MNLLESALVTKQFEVRWADCDANNHMRHTAYSDMCAHARVSFLNEIGLSSEWFKEHQIGPVLFKEETEYKSEVNIGEMLTITVEVGAPTGFSKSIQMYQRILKENGELSAEHRCVVGFMDLDISKIIDLPEQIRSLFLVESPVEVIEP